MTFKRYLIKGFIICVGCLIGNLIASRIEKKRKQKGGETDEF